MTTGLPPTGKQHSTDKPGCKTQKSTDTSREGSIFDRLHKTSTASSRTRKVTAPVLPKNILTRDENDEKCVSKPARPRRIIRATRPAPKNHNDGPVFDRLYKQGTISSSTKRKASLREGQAAAPSKRAALKPKNHL
eukprot:scaffold11525_cov135-Cylindrotheca_fusiformis.AAC.3